MSYINQNPKPEKNDLTKSEQNKLCNDNDNESSQKVSYSDVQDLMQQAIDDITPVVIFEDAFDN